jgi:hypothetical protein
VRAGHQRRPPADLEDRAEHDEHRDAHVLAGQLVDVALEGRAVRAVAIAGRGGQALDLPRGARS